MLRTALAIANFISILVCASIQAQNHCGFDERLSSVNPVVRSDVEQQIQSAISIVQFRTVTTIPIVFHIVHNSSEQNISDLQIRSQIDILNRDFAFMSENSPWVPEEFKDLGHDANLRFCLASKDPSGGTTSGITRTMTQVSMIGTHREGNGRYSVHYNEYGGKDGWDPERYINVWVAEMDGLLGSATFPGMAQHPEEDGVIIDPHYVGALGLASHAEPFHRGHTLTHELGHYFGLFHIWGEGNGGCDTDDFVEDTPGQEFAYTGCPIYPQHSCGASNMFMNFMDFTNDRCLALFTQGQVARMQAALMSFRSGLIENDDACALPDSGKIDLDDVLMYYAPNSNQIIITLDSYSIIPRQVSLYSIDGRLLLNTSWTTGSIYWFDADSLPIGVYVLRLESGGEGISRKVVVH